MVESSFSRSLRPYLPGAIRIENKVMLGMPDVYVPLGAIQHFWIETKEWKTFKPPQDLGLRPAQKVWLETRRNVPTFVVGRCRGGGIHVFDRRLDELFFDTTPRAVAEWLLAHPKRGL